MSLLQLCRSSALSLHGFIPNEKGQRHHSSEKGASRKVHIKKLIYINLRNRTGIILVDTNQMILLLKPQEKTHRTDEV